MATAAVLFATLWPFNPIPRNGVFWLQGRPGLKFEKAGMVIGRQPLTLPLEDSQSYSLELLLCPTGTDSQSPRTILAFYEPGRPQQFMLRQWTDGLIVTHDANVSSDKTRTIKIDVDHAFRDRVLVLVTIASGPDGTTVFLDGKPAGSFPKFRISREELSGQIILGTSPTAFYPFQGELRGLAIYVKELSAAQVLAHYIAWNHPRPDAPEVDGAVARYTFGEGSGSAIRNEIANQPSLEVPSHFSVPHKPFLRSASSEFYAEWGYAYDLVINILGFVPLGLAVCIFLGGARSEMQSFLMTVVAAGLLSLAIEVAQYYVPRRVSGTTDIITNTLGAAIGALLLHVGLFRRVLLRIDLLPSHSTE